MFLPARIASNVDLLANSLGALLGAMAAPLLAPTRILGGKLHAARHRLFRDGMTADAGLVIVALWLITQFHPTAQLVRHRQHPRHFRSARRTSRIRPRSRSAAKPWWCSSACWASGSCCRALMRDARGRCR